MKCCFSQPPRSTSAQSGEPFGAAADRTADVGGEALAEGVPPPSAEGVAAAPAPTPAPPQAMTSQFGASGIQTPAMPPQVDESAVTVDDEDLDNPELLEELAGLAPMDSDVTPEAEKNKHMDSNSPPAHAVSGMARPEPISSSKLERLVQSGKSAFQKKKKKKKKAVLDSRLAVGSQTDHESTSAGDASGQDEREVFPPETDIAMQARSAHNIMELATIYKDNPCTDNPGDLLALEKAIQNITQGPTTSTSHTQIVDFWTVLLPFICEQALRYQELWANENLKVIDGKSQRWVTWTQAQCLCILSNAFLCAWPGRTSWNCHCRDPGQKDLPSINLDEMLGSRGNFGPQVAKCEMLLHYFAKQYQRVQQGDTLQRTLRFVRTAVLDGTPGAADGAPGEMDGATGSAVALGNNGQRYTPSWETSKKLLRKVEVHDLFESIDGAKNMFRADFANESIGGASIAYGCVQEEIMFACHPELNCARLIFTPMKAHEAFVLCGAEQFAEPQGYAFQLKCGGPYHDETPVENHQLRSFVTAIDAIDYRGVPDRSIQFSRDNLDRDLKKAYAGFAIPDEALPQASSAAGAIPSDLATGNWGSGAFLGDAGLKCLLQWAAASQAGDFTYHYFPFDNEYIKNNFQHLADGLIAQQVTVGELCTLLFEMESRKCRSGAELFELIRMRFAIGEGS